VNLSPADYRDLVRAGSEALVAKRTAPVPPPQPGAWRGGDPARVKLESLLRHYHAGESADEVRARAEESFGGWIQKRHLVKRARNALAMLETYIAMDQATPGLPVIETYRRSECSVGDHTIRVRRDVLLFGDSGHVLRTVSWTREQTPDERLELEFCPLILATDEDLGHDRLARHELWRIREGEVVQTDPARSRRYQSALKGLLDETAQRIAQATE
jgi:hypothetical protein